MKVTFTLHNLTASYLEALTVMEAKEAFESIRKSQTGGLGHAIKMKIGNGDMRSAVEFNEIHKAPATAWDFKIEPRKGYKLVTFNAA